MVLFFVLKHKFQRNDNKNGFTKIVFKEDAAG